MSKGKVWSSVKFVFLIAAGLALLNFTLEFVPSIERFRINDDTRQNLFWAWEGDTASPFYDDLLAAHAQALTPIGVRLIYESLAKLGIEPAIANKFVEATLIICSLLLLALVARSFFSKNTLAWAFTLILGIRAPEFLRPLFGGMSRGFGPPLQMFVILGALKDRPLWMALAIFAEAYFHPPSVVCSVPVFIAWLTLYLFRRPEKERRLRKAQLGSILVVIVTLVLLALDSQKVDQRLGPIGNYEEVAQTGAFNEDSRWANERIGSILSEAVQAVTVPVKLSLNYWYSLGGLLAVPSPLVKRVRLIVFLVLLVIGSWFALRTNHSTPTLKPVVILSIAVLAALGGNILARMFLFKLYFPNRYLVPAFPLISLLLSGWALAGLVSSVRVKYRPLSTGFVTAVILLILGTGFRPGEGLTADERSNRDLLFFVSSLPQDAVIAGPPRIMNSVPLLARHRALVTSEHFLPLFPKYYREINNRLEATIRALFAEDSRPLSVLAESHGVTHLVVDLNLYSSLPPECSCVPRTTPSKVAPAPFDTFARKLEGGRPASDFVPVAEALSGKAVWNNECFAVLAISQ